MWFLKTVLWSAYWLLFQWGGICMLGSAGIIKINRHFGHFPKPAVALMLPGRLFSLLELATGHPACCQNILICSPRSCNRALVRPVRSWAVTLWLTRSPSAPCAKVCSRPRQWNHQYRNSSERKGQFSTLKNPTLCVQAQSQTLNLSCVILWAAHSLRFTDTMKSHADRT